MSFKWTCPFCNKNAFITDDFHHVYYDLFDKLRRKNLISSVEIIECPNPDCNEFTFNVSLNKEITPYQGAGIDERIGHSIGEWNLIPPSNAKPFPSYIPNSIIKDYEEACLIKNLSPKASATLSRRCLQGMIRDFWGIRKKRLIDEINELKDKVASQTWKAIDSIREVGNIGAHMEKDVNLIIEIEPNEAELLIRLIENLIQDWYIQRHERERMLKEVTDLAKEKKKKKTK